VGESVNEASPAQPAKQLSAVRWAAFVERESVYEDLNGEIINP
jgi:hypothetical protein